MITYYRNWNPALRDPSISRQNQGQILLIMKWSELLRNFDRCFYHISDVVCKHLGWRGPFWDLTIARFWTFNVAAEGDCLNCSATNPQFHAGYPSKWGNIIHWIFTIPEFQFTWKCLLLARRSWQPTYICDVVGSVLSWGVLIRSQEMSKHLLVCQPPLL